MDRAEYARDVTVEDDLAWVGDTLLAAARQVAGRLAPPDQTPDAWEERRAHLAHLHALSVIQEWAATVMSGAAEAAGQAGASYADLGRAVGISKQAARKRWPEALEDPRPGRPPLPPTLLDDDLPAALAEEAFEQALAAWPEIADPDATDGGVPCQVWHPGPDGAPDEPVTWSWQPGTITERCAPNEWVVELTSTDETCFRDITEIRPA